MDTMRGKDADPAAEAGALLLLDEPTTGLHPPRREAPAHRAAGARRSRAQRRRHRTQSRRLEIRRLDPRGWTRGGSNGGRIVAEGTPEQVAAADTETSPFLRDSIAGEEKVIALAAEDAAS